MTDEIKLRIEQINRGEVPQGYKKTEVGIVPCEWKVDKLRSIGFFEKGRGIPGTAMKKEGVPCVGYGDIYTKYNYKFDKAVNFVDEDVAKTGLEVNKGALLFTCSGETAIEIGKCVCYTGEDPIYVGGDIAVLNIEKDIDPLFVSYQQNISASINKKATYGQGHSVVHIYSDSLGRLEIAYPKDIKEQQHISEILSKWDEAISLQEKLIESIELKKKTISQKIFSNFNSGIEFKLGDICSITTGSLDANAMSEDGKYPFFTCSKEVYAINEYAFDAEALLIAGNGDIGTIKYYDGKFNAYQRTYVLTSFKYPIKYVKYYLEHNLIEDIRRETQKSSMPYIKLGTLKNITIFFDEAKSDYIVKTLDALDELIDKEKSIKEYLIKQQKAIHKMLLTGVLRV